MCLCWSSVSTRLWTTQTSCWRALSTPTDRSASTRLSLYPPICPSLPALLSVPPPACLSVCLSLHLHDALYLSVCLYLLVCLSLNRSTSSSPAAQIIVAIATYKWLLTSPMRINILSQSKYIYIHRNEHIYSMHILYISVSVCACVCVCAVTWVSRSSVTTAATGSCSLLSR